MNFCNRRIGAAALMVALLSGCVSTSVYPDHWAEQVEAELASRQQQIFNQLIKV